MTANRPARGDDAAIEAALADLAQHLRYPPTPPLGVAVRRRLAAAPAPPPSSWLRLPPFRVRLALAAVALLLTAGAAGLLSPTVRTVIAERLGFLGIDIHYLRVIPTVAPISDATGRALPAGIRLGLGQLTTMAEARERVSYPVLVPSLLELAEPDEVYVSEAPPGHLTLVYFPRPGLPATPETQVGLLLTQFDGSLVRGGFGKGLGPGTELEEVEVNGAYGLWIHGNPHAVFGYQDARGELRIEPTRLAGNTLLWQRSSHVLRLEGAQSKSEMLRIATSVQ